MVHKTFEEILTQSVATCCILALTFVGIVGIVLGCNTRLPGACPTGPHEHAGFALWIAGVVCWAILACVICILVACGCYQCLTICLEPNVEREFSLEPLPPSPTLAFTNKPVPQRTMVPADTPSFVLDMTQPSTVPTSTDFASKVY